MQGDVVKKLTGNHTDLVKASLRAKTVKPLSILLLGGTGFLGPHIVKYAISRGHQVTLFNRDSSEEDLFPDLEVIVGNRDPDIDKGLEGLKGKHWDCVIDTSGYVPRIVDASSKLLSQHCRQYLYISSISVYSDLTQIGLDENSVVGTLDNDKEEIINGETYGPLKAYCEQAAENNFPARTTVIRPGLIVGPRDTTDRYTYWPLRVAKGGEVLAPGDGKDFVQYIDVRDLGAFIVRCLEQKMMGIFNATSALNNETTLDMLNYCKQNTSSEATFTWVDAEFLASQNVQPWTDMPVWVPRQGELGGISQVSVAKAKSSGLTIRPRKATVRDTLVWFNEQTQVRQTTIRSGMSPEKEAAVLKAWHGALKT